MTRIIITVDDDDRDQCPDNPWTATIDIGYEGGSGATAAEAIADALARNGLSDLGAGQLGPFYVGMPDPTPEDGDDYCGATSPDGLVCTWGPGGHEGRPHVAGNGDLPIGRAVGVWWDATAVLMPGQH